MFLGEAVHQCFQSKKYLCNEVSTFSKPQTEYSFAMPWRETWRKKMMILITPFENTKLAKLSQILGLNRMSHIHDIDRGHHQNQRMNSNRALDSQCHWEEVY